MPVVSISSDWRSDMNKMPRWLAELYCLSWRGDRVGNLKNIDRARPAPTKPPTIGKVEDATVLICNPSKGSAEKYLK